MAHKQEGTKIKLNYDRGSKHELSVACLSLQASWLLSWVKALALFLEHGEPCSVRACWRKYTGVCDLPTLQAASVSEEPLLCPTAVACSHLRPPLFFEGGDNRPHTHSEDLRREGTKQSDV